MAAAAAAVVVVVVVEGLRLFSVGIGRNPDPVSDPFVLSLLGCPAQTVANHVPTWKSKIKRLYSH